VVGHVYGGGFVVGLFGGGGLPLSLLLLQIFALL
jgi:hypothetical protein